MKYMSWSFLFCLLTISCVNGKKNQPENNSIMSQKEEIKDKIYIACSSVNISTNSHRAVLKNGLGIDYLITTNEGNAAPIKLKPADEIALSQSGSCIALRSKNTITVVQEDETTNTLELEQGGKILSIALSDDGTSLAVLRKLSGSKGKIEIWENKPYKLSFEQEVICYENGFLKANADLSLLSFKTSATIDPYKSKTIFRRETKQLIEMEDLPNTWINAVLFNHQIWLTFKDKLVCYAAQQEKVELEGNGRTNIVFSPSGSNAVLYSNEKSIDVTSEQVVFKIIDLPSLVTIDTFVAVIPNFYVTGIALMDDHSVVTLNIDREGNIDRKQIH